MLPSGPGRCIVRVVDQRIGVQKKNPVPEIRMANISTQPITNIVFVAFMTFQLSLIGSLS